MNLKKINKGVKFILFNAIFKNMVEETGVFGENHKNKPTKHTHFCIVWIFYFKMYMYRENYLQSSKI